MNRDQKAAVVEQLAEQIRSAETIFAVDYRGISVSQAADLRGRLRDAETRFRIVKNSLTERATDQAGADALKAMLEGPTALAFVSGDAAVAARALSDAGRALGTLEFKGGVMNGAALSADEVRTIARLPSREVLQGQLVGTIAAPLSGLVRTLNALIAGVAVQLQQIAEQKEETSPASEAATPRSETDDGPEAARAPSSEDAPPPEPEAEAEAAQAASSEDESPPESEAEAEAARTPSSEDAPPPEPEAEAEAAQAASDADESPPESEPEADAAEAPAEVAEEPAETEQTETEAASDAEASEATEEEA